MVVDGLGENPDAGSGITLPQIAREGEEWRCQADPDPQTVVARGLSLAGTSTIIKRAANSLWYELVIEFGPDRVMRRSPVIVERSSTELPFTRRMFSRIGFMRPSANPSQPFVNAQVIPVLGKSFEEGKRFPAHRLQSPLRVGTVAQEYIRTLFGTRKVADELDLYMEINMGEDEHVTYRGIMDLRSAKECWAFNYPSSPLAATEKEALRRALERQRLVREKSA
jgi:hypothetical protein